MPQLEISTYTTQIFWVLVTFIIFWQIMDHFIIPRISDMIDARKRKYDDFILKAEEINKKALATLERYEETLAAAKKEANKQIEENEQELKKMIEEREEEISQKLKQKIEESEEKLKQEQQATMDKIEELSEKAAIEIVKELGLKKITIEDIQELSKQKDSEDEYRK